MTCKDGGCLRVLRELRGACQASLISVGWRRGCYCHEMSWRVTMSSGGQWEHSESPRGQWRRVAVRKLIRCASITQLGSFVSDVRNFERMGECWRSLPLQHTMDPKRKQLDVNELCNSWNWSNNEWERAPAGEREAEICRAQREFIWVYYDSHHFDCSIVTLIWPRSSGTMTWPVNVIRPVCWWICLTSFPFYCQPFKIISIIHYSHQYK